MIEPTYNLVSRIPFKRLVGPVNSLIITMMLLVLSGCNSGALAPKGMIAAAELKLIVFSAALMLLVVIPHAFPKHITIKYNLTPV